MNPTLVKDRTHCPKGHDLRIHGYYFGANQRCRICNSRPVRVRQSGTKNQVSEERTSNVDRNEGRTIPPSIRGLSLVDFAPEKLLSSPQPFKSVTPARGVGAAQVATSL